MKKLLTVIVSILAGILFCGLVYGAGELAAPTRGTQPSQTFAPEGSLTTTLTVVKTTTDLTGKIMYNIQTPTGTTCLYRLMPTSTSTQATYKRVTVPVVTNVTRAVNRTTPFLNLSGCTAGTLELQ